MLDGIVVPHGSNFLGGILGQGIGGVIIVSLVRHEELEVEVPVVVDMADWCFAPPALKPGPVHFCKY